MLGKDLVAIVAGYLLGSVNFAHIIARLHKGLDLREVGDGNVGARNVWHVVTPFWGAMASVLDGLKGVGVVLLAHLLGASMTGELLAGPAAILGHCFPVWMRFRGGKGVATLAGVLLVWTPWSALTALGLVGLSQLAFHNMDRAIPVGAIASIFLPPLFGYPWTMMLYAFALLALVGLKKMVDLPHERQVWATAGWKDVGRNDWYPGVHAGQGEDVPDGPAQRNGVVPPDIRGL